MAAGRGNLPHRGPVDRADNYQRRGRLSVRCGQRGDGGAHRDARPGLDRTSEAGVGQAAVAARRPHRGRRGRARPVGVAGQRPAVRGCQARERGRHHRALPVLRRLGNQTRGQHGATVQSGRIPLHQARTGRRLRADHAVELPADDRGVEARPRARHRQRLDPETGRADAAHRDPARRAVRGGRFPAGDREPADRGPADPPVLARRSCEPAPATSSGSPWSSAARRR